MFSALLPVGFGVAWCQAGPSTDQLAVPAPWEELVVAVEVPADSQWGRRAVADNQGN